MPSFDPPQQLPARLLGDAEMIRACQQRDFATVFRILKSRAGLYPSLIARRCEMTPSRVGEVLKGQRVIRDLAVIERIADGLHIPGELLGLARRKWEQEERQPPHPTLPSIGQSWTAADNDPTDPQFTMTLIESQLPQHYASANFFGAGQAVPALLHHGQTITRLLESSPDGVRFEIRPTHAPHGLARG